MACAGRPVRRRGREAGPSAARGSASALRAGIVRGTARARLSDRGANLGPRRRDPRVRPRRAVASDDQGVEPRRCGCARLHPRSSAGARHRSPRAGAACRERAHDHAHRRGIRIRQPLGVEHGDTNPEGTTAPRHARRQRLERERCGRTLDAECDGALACGSDSREPHSQRGVMRSLGQRGGSQPHEAVPDPRRRRGSVVDQELVRVELPVDLGAQRDARREHRVGPPVVGIERHQVPDARHGPVEVARETQVQRLRLELLLLRQPQPRLDVGIGDVAGLGQDRGGAAGAEHIVVPRRHLVGRDPHVTHQRPVDVLRHVQRRALVPEAVVGLGLVDVVAAAGVGVVVDRQEQIGPERLREPHALGEVGAQRAVLRREVVAVGGARHQHLGARRAQQVAQPQRDAEIHLGFGETVHPDRAPEEPAVTGIEHDAPPVEPPGIDGAERIGQAVVAGLGSRQGDDGLGRPLRGAACGKRHETGEGEERRPQCPDPEVRWHSAAAASRPAALLLLDVSP